MASKQAYEGGAWSVGSCAPYRPPATLSAIELARRRQDVVTHYLPFAEAQAAAGRPWYPGICCFYHDELAQIDALLAAGADHQRARRAKRGAA